MADNFKVSLRKVIDEFKLEVIYIHKDANEVMIEENDVTDLDFSSWVFMSILIRSASR